jgi:protein ImuA
MQFISAHNGKIQTLVAVAGRGRQDEPDQAFATGLEAFDTLAPRSGFARGAIHELLFSPDDPPPQFIAALLARHAALTTPIIWSDPRRQIYPPALAAMGFDLSRLYLLRPRCAKDESWAITECLRCRGVGAVIAAPQAVSRIEARRWQLAAERGGGAGIFLRPRGRSDSIYAAATRWLVSPCPGERTIQRWTIQLLHGHGGRVGRTVILELCRENHSVRALEKLPDRQSAPTAEERRIA